MVHLERLTDILKQYNVLKKKLNNRRLDYDAKLNKVQKSRKEKPEAEEELRTAQFKFEESMSDMKSLMSRFIEKEVSHLCMMIRKMKLCQDNEGSSSHCKALAVFIFRPW